MIGARGPALRFWLDYLESRGGLWEPSGDTVLAMLPEQLRDTHDLPESALMTDDPDIAREDGVLFLGAGNPEIHKGADLVVEAGDVGTLAVAHTGKALTTDDVLAKIRDRVAVSHGRIDATGSALRSHRPTLRLAALAGYSVSADEQFTEVLECLVDVQARVEWTGDADKRLRAAISTGAAPGKPVTGELHKAVSAAHQVLDLAALDRSKVLAVGTDSERAAELARAGDYYDAALAAIDKRRSTADAQRLTLLDARAAATVAERDRRLAEIDEKYRTTHELRYFRLHVIDVPVWQLAVDVRRGDRRWPMTFDFIPLTGTVAPTRCPTCDAHAPLVAVKTHLGCTACVLTPAPVAPQAPPPAARKPPAKPAPKSVVKQSAPKPAPVPVPVPERPKSPRKPLTPGKLQARKTNEFWQCVVQGDTRRLHRLVDPGSPLAALIRVYGAAGPLYGVGLGPGSVVTDVAQHRDPLGTAGLPATSGFVRAFGQEHPFLLLWSPGALPAEIYPFSSTMQLGLMRFGGVRSFDKAPAPHEPVDPVARLLLTHTTRRFGLPMTARALAAWWRLPDPEILLASYPAEVLAGTLDRAVRHWFGLPRSFYPETAVAFGADEALMRKANTALQKRLTLTTEHPW